jgi:hypothetical protein
LAIDLAAHLHHSIRDFGLISLKQIIQTYVQKVRHVSRTRTANSSLVQTFPGAVEESSS